LLLLWLCCSSWSASFVFFQAPQLEICKRDMVRTQRLWQTHYQKKKPQKKRRPQISTSISHSSTHNRNLNLSLFPHTISTLISHSSTHKHNLNLSSSKLEKPMKSC
jgi:hypothetical protein